MGNSVHSRITRGDSEGSPRSLRNKSLAEGADAADKGESENGPSGKGQPGEAELSVRPEPLTEEQVEMLRENWKELEANIARVGVITFISLFETHPDVQEVFIPFQGMGLEELRHSKQLRAHALRVMGFVQKAVARLHEPEKLDVLLRELGKKHYSYGAKQQYIDYIAPEFIQAIKPSLEDKWSDEVEEAWIALFNYMGVIMKAAMDLEEQRAAAASLPPYKVSSSTNTSLPHASPGPLSFTPTKASRRSSDVVGGAGGGGGGIVGSSRRGTLF
ncbi:non-symbiotic hemoglobin 1-like isoform X1 [Ischnura elegans]|uniref:non-symbiotic hemoglobin 1-like isoform X1 n=1 Tax=Ischnura elegans TaxID=197161 RepID=UPI001ED89594|nr:non-symbiotic hemoglobin 1-like isoform X1 [Ischnura elegans]